MFHTAQLLLRLALVLLCVVRFTNSTFVYNKDCNVNTDNLKLRPFIIDAAVDVDDKKLKFFMNSQVANMRRNYSSNYTNIVIDDVNYQTNKYTTFHIEIDFMGKVIIQDNKRFCDMIAVKNTTDFRDGPRFRYLNTTLNDTQTISMTDPFSNIGHNTTVISKRDLILERNHRTFRSNTTLLSRSNTTIERLFSNSTGQLVECPLYYNDSIVLYYEADISHHFHRLGSYEIKFTVVSNDEASQIIGCSRSFITPVQPAIINGIVAYGVLVLLIVTAVVNILIMAYSTYQESSNPFLYKASTICNLALLKQVDASLPGIIGYLQYAFFIGGLDLAYPGFYQPMIGQIKWCALLGFSFVSDRSRPFKKYVDNLYATLDAGGLPGLTKSSSGNPVLNNWANFMVTLIIITAITVVFNQAFVIVKLFLAKANLLKFSSNHAKVAGNFKGFSVLSRKNLYLILGQVLHSFLIIFGMPFLILTTFQFLAAGDINGKHRYFSNYDRLKRDAYSMETPYYELTVPSSVFLFSSQIGMQPTCETVGRRGPLGGYQRDEAENSFRWNYDPSNSTTDAVDEGMRGAFNGTSTHQRPYMKVSEASIALASICFILWIAVCAYFIFHYLLAVRRHFKVTQSSNVSRLYTSLKTILIWAFLYHEYRPPRVNFVIYDILSLLSKLFVIGLLQNHGVVQVILLIIIAVVDLFVLYVYKPYFVQISWWSLKVMFPVARFLISTLCIPFIRQLDINESVKTYVAYVQLLISAVVVIIFSIQLCYWFLRTCILIFKKFRSRHKIESAFNHNLASDDSLEEFHRQFEYKPLQPPPSYKTQVQSVANNEQMSDDDGEELTQQYATDEVENELEGDYYYRKKSEMILKKLHPGHEVQKVVSNSSESNFQQLQNESNLRRIKNDYKVREGDQIYKKYFTDDMIDPEVKELWESRKDKLQDDEMPEYKSSYNNMTFSKIKGLMKPKQKPQKEVGFHVNRPKQLVVKTMDQIKQEQQQRQQKEQLSHKEESIHSSGSSTSLI
ncbi:hypothetical protein Cantr_06675 [Candida viswanathii]|uniref:TRP C-terminal domain-containing protein n=1 Tax=Candida viswanathii TaxID=5486 RepID=A0A367XVC1_9ASCO|nr:hypothetical protein Cantr_06675 [Candida viswanathii]